MLFAKAAQQRRLINRIAYGARLGDGVEFPDSEKFYTKACE